MKEGFLMGVAGFCGLVVLVGIGWLVAGNDLAMQGFFAPRVEHVRRVTFEQSKAYNEGMKQEIQNMQFEYIKATPEQKQALASIILHRTADYDLTKFPPDLQSFLESIRPGYGIKPQADARY